MLPVLLKNRIRAKEISERQAAREIGVAPTTVSRILAGESVDIDTLVKVCAWIGVSPSIILDTYVSDDYQAQIVALLGAYPELSEILLSVIEKMKAGKIEPSFIKDIVAYIAFRSGERV